MSLARPSTGMPEDENSRRPVVICSIIYCKKKNALVWFCILPTSVDVVGPRVAAVMVAQGERSVEARLPKPLAKLGLLGKGAPNTF